MFFYIEGILHNFLHLHLVSSLGHPGFFQDIPGEKYLHRGGRCKEHFGVNARYSFSLLVGQQGSSASGELSQKNPMEMNYSPWDPWNWQIS